MFSFLAFYLHWFIVYNLLHRSSLRVNEKKTYFRKRIEMFLIRKRFLRVTISETFAKVLTAIDIPWLNRV